ncbi:MAG: hypothetical protein GWP50_09950 [Proteobacteria bacterium]|nr:hypothetical protein [Pseudomonadota bacterium]
MFKRLFFQSKFLLVGLVLVGQSVAAKDQQPIDLYELGKMVYNKGTDSCRSCHGIDGAGTTRSSVDLRAPSSWKSVQYERVLKGSTMELSSQSLVRTLIALGAKGWNEENFGKVRDHLSQPEASQADKQGTPPPFDEEMIGLDSPNKRTLTTHVIRLMRKAGMPRPKPQEIQDLLAASALTYIETEFME